MTGSRLGVVIVLGLTQTLAWASTYYLPAILADRIAADLGMSSTWFFAAFSGALVVSALVGPRAGRMIDATGGKGVLVASNLIIAAGLTLLASAHSQMTLWLAWIFLGVGMGIGLYDAAFAVLGRLYGADARASITGITLIAGFASTVGWPLTAWGLSAFGWRETCLAWAAAHILLGLPLNLFLLPKATAHLASTTEKEEGTIVLDRQMIILSVAFAAGWIVVAAMAVHLPRILEAAGATTAQAVTAGALIGPAQVAARITEAALLKRYHPIASARLSVVLHPLGVGVLALFGAGFGSGLFAVLHGAGSGVLTIVRGTLPLALFGPANYGYRLGLLGAPSRVAMAATPLLFGLLVERYGAGALIVSSLLGMSSLLALMLLSKHNKNSRETRCGTWGRR